VASVDKVPSSGSWWIDVLVGKFGLLTAGFIGVFVLWKGLFQPMHDEMATRLDVARIDLQVFSQGLEQQEQITENLADAAQLMKETATIMLEIRKYDDRRTP